MFGTIGTLARAREGARSEPAVRKSVRSVPAGSTSTGSTPGTSIGFAVGVGAGLASGDIALPDVEYECPR